MARPHHQAPDQGSGRSRMVPPGQTMAVAPRIVWLSRDAPRCGARTRQEPLAGAGEARAGQCADALAHERRKGYSASCGPVRCTVPTGSRRRHAQADAGAARGTATREASATAHFARRGQPWSLGCARMDMKKGLTNRPAPPTHTTVAYL
jgi:hypothetical protein